MTEGQTDKESGLFSRLYFIILFGIMAAGVLSYFPSFDGYFYLDDPVNILIPPVMLEDLSLSSLLTLVRDSPSPTRAVANLTFGLNYYIGGTSLFGYHLVNLIFHLASGILVYLLFSQLLMNEFPEKDARRISFLGSLLWIVHPVNPQTVTYIVQRMTVLSVFFFLLGYLSFLKAEESSGGVKARWWVGVVVCYILSVFSKEMTIVFPIVLFLHRLYFGNTGEKSLLRYGAGCIALMVAVFTLVIVLSRYGSVSVEQNISDFSMRDFTVFERLLTQFRVIFSYIGLILFPTPERLMLDHYVAKSTGLFTPVTTFFGMCGIVVLLGLSVFLFRRRRLPSYFIIWYFLNLSVESSIIPLELMFEHRMYLPMLGVIFFVLYWLSHLLKSHKWGRKMFLAGTIGVAIVFGVMTYQRNALYGDPLLFWEDNLRKAPEKARVHNSVGYVHFVKRNFVRAESEYESALALLSEKAWERPIVHFNMGMMYYQGNRLEDAEREFSRAVTLRPDFVNAIINLGAVYIDMHRHQAAIPLFEDIKDWRYLPPDFYHNFGLAYYYDDDFTNAERYLKMALKMNPDLKDGNLFLGRIKLEQGRFSEAKDYFAREYEISKDGTMYNYYLGLLAEKKGDHGSAKKLYEAAQISEGSGHYRKLAGERAYHLK